MNARAHCQQDTTTIEPSSIAPVTGVTQSDNTWQPAAEIGQVELEELQRASQQFRQEHGRVRHDIQHPKASRDVLGLALLKVASKTPPPLPDSPQRDFQKRDVFRPEPCQPGRERSESPADDERVNWTEEFEQDATEIISVASSGDRRGLPRRPGKSGTRALLRDGKLAAGSQDWAFHATGHPARLVDLCLTGAAFLTDQPYELDSELGIRFESPDGQPVCDRQGQIVRVLQLGANRWKIVCQLGRPLEHPQLADLSMHVFQSNLI